MGLLCLDVVCSDDRCLINSEEGTEYIDVVAGIDGHSLHGSISISTTARGSCIVDDMRRRGCGRID